MQSTNECAVLNLRIFIDPRIGDQYAHTTHTACLLLRERCEPPHGCRATDKRNELAPPCMSRKQHIEGWRGSVHYTAPVATGSPQPPRLLDRERAWCSSRFFHSRTVARA